MTEPAAYLDIRTKDNHKDSFWKIKCNNRLYGAWRISWPLAGLGTGGFLADAFEQLICINWHSCTYPADVPETLVGVPQQLSGRWWKKRESLSPLVALQQFLNFKWQGFPPLFLLFLLYSVVFNWSGKGCLVVCVFLCVLLVCNSLTRTTAKLKRKRKDHQVVVFYAGMGYYSF